MNVPIMLINIDVNYNQILLNMKEIRKFAITDENRNCPLHYTDLHYRLIIFC